MTTHPDRPLRSLPWLLAWLAVPLACHFGFSWNGFNPTDDGWLLAVARRLADGEVPHRDFIFVRPALSAVFNVPFVLWGGDYAIWWSRLGGWLTLAAVAALWTHLIQRGRPAEGPLRRKLESLALYTVALALAAHTFPVMTWHSLDGMLLCSLAVWALAGERPRPSLAYLCVGCAALCRQNFACFVPVLMLAAPETMRSLRFLWSAAPPLAYLGAMFALSAGQDYLAQVFASGQWFFDTAFMRYAKHPYFLASLVLGFGAAGLAAHPRTQRSGTLLALASLAAAIGLAAFSLWRGLAFYNKGAFFLFGLAAGLSAWRLSQRSFTSERLTLLGGLGLVWATAISYGYNSPALGAGISLLLLWRLLFRSEASANIVSATPWLAIAAATLVGGAFVHARWNHIPRERPASENRAEVGEVLPGGDGLRTNPMTYVVLEELAQLRRQLGETGHPHAIITDFSAAWLRGPRNPLPVEWAQSTELGDKPALLARVTDAIAAWPATHRIIVQRIRVTELDKGLLNVPPTDPYYAVQNWVVGHCAKVQSGRFFDVYAPPSARPVP